MGMPEDAAEPQAGVAPDSDAPYRRITLDGTEYELRPVVTQLS
jgi:hypothetical protein